MTATVYVTRAGRRYHYRDVCPAVEAAHLIWDSDEFTAPAYPLEPTPWPDGVADREPCAVCLPHQRAALHRSSHGRDFGHVAVDEYDGTPEGARGVTRMVCTRCITWTRWADVGLSVGARASWPCTSAVVLGLVERSAVLEAVR